MSYTLRMRLAKGTPQGGAWRRRSVAGVVDVCSMCGPRYCAMKISDDARKFAEAGMQEKATEFSEASGEIFQEIAKT